MKLRNVIKTAKFLERKRSVWSLLDGKRSFLKNGLCGLAAKKKILQVMTKISTLSEFRQKFFILQFLKLILLKLLISIVRFQSTLTVRSKGSKLLKVKKMVSKRNLLQEFFLRSNWNWNIKISRITLPKKFKMFWNLC